jgi:glycosyltransferase involved in cell wall biosynthesis
MATVSICIPTYNSASYLPQAIDSVLRQDFRDYELVICDNASTDDTQEICENYRDSRIRYVHFAEFTNQAGNFNRCLDEVRGEFFTLLHADDFFLPGFLTDRVKRLSARPEAGFVFGAVKVVDSKGTPISIKGQWPVDRCFGPGELLESLLFGCIVSAPSLMVRKSCARKAGLFRTDLTWGHDWDWSLRLAQVTGANYAAEPLAAYREHDASGTAEILGAAGNGRQERRILRETFARLSVEDQRWRNLRRPAYRALSRRHMYFAELGLLEGQRAVSRNNLYYAALADWLMLRRPTFWALLFGSFGPKKLYSRYRAFRDAMAASGGQ